MRPLECKNNSPKIKICFGYVKLHVSLATSYVIVKKGSNPRVYLQIYSYISSSLSLNTKTWYHSTTAQSITSFILSSTSTSSHIFVGLLRLFCATTFSLDTSAIQAVLRSTCPNHLILLVRGSTSRSWMQGFERRES